MSIAVRDILLLSAQANGEGFLASLAMPAGRRRWMLALRLSWRNGWIGLRFSDFPPPYRVHVVTVQPLPCVGLQIIWRAGK